MRRSKIVNPVNLTPIKILNDYADERKRQIYELKRSIAAVDQLIGGDIKFGSVNESLGSLEIYCKKYEIDLFRKKNLLEVKDFLSQLISNRKIDLKSLEKTIEYTKELEKQ